MQPAKGKGRNVSTGVGSLAGAARRRQARRRDTRGDTEPSAHLGAEDTLLNHFGVHVAIAIDARPAKHGVGKVPRVGPAVPAPVR